MARFKGPRLTQRSEDWQYRFGEVSSVSLIIWNTGIKRVHITPGKNNIDMLAVTLEYQNQRDKASSQLYFRAAQNRGFWPPSTGAQII